MKLFFNLSNFIYLIIGLSLNKYIMVLEYANQGNLRDYLENHFDLLQWNEKIQMALDIICGLKWLHFKQIIHGDLVM